MDLDEFKEAMKEIEGAFVCPRCGGSLLVAYTGWRGHGIGIRGASYYTPREQEEIHPRKHCTCPGGPVWKVLRKIHPDVFKWDEVYRRWLSWDKKEQCVLFFLPADGRWYEMEHKKWRKFLQEKWETFLQALENFPQKEEEEKWLK